MYTVSKTTAMLLRNAVLPLPALCAMSLAGCAADGAGPVHGQNSSGLPAGVEAHLRDNGMDAEQLEQLRATWSQLQQEAAPEGRADSDGHLSILACAGGEVGVGVQGKGTACVGPSGGRTVTIADTGAGVAADAFAVIYREVPEMPRQDYTGAGAGVAWWPVGGQGYLFRCTGECGTALVIGYEAGYAAGGGYATMSIRKHRDDELTELPVRYVPGEERAARVQEPGRDARETWRQAGDSARSAGEQVEQGLSHAATDVRELAEQARQGVDSAAEQAEAHLVSAQRRAEELATMAAEGMRETARDIRGSAERVSENAEEWGEDLSEELRGDRDELELERD
jgi:hypothetical protein